MTGKLGDRCDDPIYSQVRRGGCLVFLGLTACIVGCGDEDRVLTARCSNLNGAFSAAFSLSDTEYAVVGDFGARQDLGSIFQLISGDAGTNGARWVLSYELDVPIKNTTQSPLSFGNVVHTRLLTDLDEDAERLAESSREKIESTLAAGTRILAGDVKIETVPDVLSLINDDPKALDILQSTTKQHRYFVLTSVAFTKGATLFYEDAAQGPYSIPFGSPQTFKLGKLYFHVSYSCPPLESIVARAASTGMRVPTGYFYTAIRYDNATKRAQLDRREVDLNLFSFMP